MREDEDLLPGKETRERALDLQVEGVTRDLAGRKVADEVLEIPDPLDGPGCRLLVHDEDRKDEPLLRLYPEACGILVDEAELTVRRYVPVGDTPRFEGGGTAARVRSARPENQEQHDRHGRAGGGHDEVGADQSISARGGTVIRTHMLR